jgi:hypothetical protein
MLHSAVNILFRSWSDFTDSLGSTTLGFFAPQVVPAVALAIYIVIVFRRAGWAGVKEHIGKTLGIAAGVAIAAEIAVYGLILILTVPRTIYSDHVSLAHRVQALSDAVHGDQSHETRSVQSVRTVLEQQISDLREMCARLDGSNQVLVKQTTAQQSTINGCLNQAVKLLTPAPLNVTPVSLFDDPSPDGGRVVRMVVLSNKIITPVRLAADCDRPIKAVVASIVPGDPTAKGETHVVGQNSFFVAIPSPVWSPTSPILLNISYVGENPLNCIFMSRQ